MPIGENVLNFHHSDDAYYEEWFDEVMEDDGWIALLNFRSTCLPTCKPSTWILLRVGRRAQRNGMAHIHPEQLCRRIDDCVEHRYGLLG